MSWLPNLRTRNVFLCDIDGTVANLSHRLHLIKDEPYPTGGRNWTAFFKECRSDTPIEPVIRTVKMLLMGEAKIVFVSGRSDEVEFETRKWLCDHLGVCSDLYMRKAGDHRPDYIVKSELLDKILEKYPIERIVGVFDDRNSVVGMWRKRGLTCFQVAEGDF